MENNWLGSQLRVIRNQRGLTLVQAAERAESSASYISDVEVGRTLPSLPMLEKLATAYGVELCISFGDSGRELFTERIGELETKLAEIRAIVDGD